MNDGIRQAAVPCSKRTLWDASLDPTVSFKKKQNSKFRAHAQHRMLMSIYRYILQ